MSKAALIVGGSPAGIQAALDLADSGIRVHLMTSEPFLGNTGAGSVNDPLWMHRLLEIAKHPRISLWTHTRLESAEGESRSFHITLCQQPRYVDVTKCTACGDCIDACPVTVSGTDHKAVSLMEGGQPGCAVIHKQGNAPCTNACPGGIPVQGYVALIAQGRLKEALDLIEEAIPFPGICGRVCTHPCEVNCRRSELDEPVAIRQLKRFVADWALSQPEKKPVDGIPVSADAKQVAVVGAGPAGMTTADRLAKQGYRVTVFEKLPVIAGMMGVGIPAYRLPREVIEREYSRIRSMGVEIRLNTPIGPEGVHTLDDLFKMGYSAVCLTVGAHKSLELHIPGETLPGVVQGIDVLKTVSLSQQCDDPAYTLALDRMLTRRADTRAVVLGGGNTAMDAARSLKRLGLSDVKILYRRSRAEMPALPEEIEDTEHEGVSIEFLTAPVRVLGDEKTGVTGLECIRMKLTDPDESGRRRPVPIAGSEFLLDLDLVVLAIGQVPDTALLGESPDLTVTREGRIQLKDGGFMTHRPGVFAAGDAVTRDKMAVIEAIGMGKKAAAEIDAYLKDLDPSRLTPETSPLPIAMRDLADSEKKSVPRVPVATLSVKKRVMGFQEVEQGYTENQAVAEANRCLACGPCSECMACVGVCKPEAVLHRQREAMMELNVGAILYADEPEHDNDLPVKNLKGVLRVPPESSLGGSAAAAKVMFDLFSDRDFYPARIAPVYPDIAGRIGVFVCRCGDEIAKIVDTATVRERATTWPDVGFASELAFSCSPEAAETICAEVKAHNLKRVVLAACSCCSMDQVCYSCTYQRVRCKQNLGVLGTKTDGYANRLSEAGLPPEAFTFVNIREQCAWAHPEDSKAATAKATALVAAAIGNARSSILPPAAFQPKEPSVMIIGAGGAAASCLDALDLQGISVSHIPDIPTRIQHAEGRYAAAKDGQVWQAGGVVLAPRDADERHRLLAAFGTDGMKPPVHAGERQLVTVGPGIFLCEPNLDTRVSGPAAAVKVTAWFGRIFDESGRFAAVVDSNRCRACSTCVETCELGAPEIIGAAPQRTATIDPAVCTGCGSCAARCPSDAIRTGSPSDSQLEAIMDAVLS